MTLPDRLREIACTAEWNDPVIDPDDLVLAADVLEKLPVTGDGVPVVPGVDRIWYMTKNRWEVTRFMVMDWETRTWAAAFPGVVGLVAVHNCRSEKPA